MAVNKVYCEECLEDIPKKEVLLEDGRLYCARCGSEVEVEDPDLFEQISDNQSAYLFRDDTDDQEDDEEDLEADDEPGDNLKSGDEVSDEDDEDSDYP